MSFDQMPSGHFASGYANSDGEFLGLLRGHRYRVVKAFKDFDGDEHPVGESWIYLGHNFVPYHDGLSRFVSFDAHHEWQIRMHWTHEDQGPIIDAMTEYVTESKMP